MRGEAPRDDRERLQLAYRAYEKKLHATSARLFAAAMDADPKLAGDRQAQHRYNAACAAALAAAATKRARGTNSTPLVGEDTGGGADTPLTDADRAKLRDQARAWLDAELAAWRKSLESGDAQQRPAIVANLKHWQQDPDLGGVRDQGALAKLPANERDAWKALWANVDALLAKARKP